LIENMDGVPFKKKHGYDVSNIIIYIYIPIYKRISPFVRIFLIVTFAFTLSKYLYMLKNKLNVKIGFQFFSLIKKIFFS
jgi:hypothetical protein